MNKVVEKIVQKITNIKGQTRREALEETRKYIDNIKLSDSGCDIDKKMEYIRKNFKDSLKFKIEQDEPSILVKSAMRRTEAHKKSVLETLAKSHSKEER